LLYDSEKYLVNTPKYYLMFLTPQAIDGIIQLNMQPIALLSNQFLFSPEGSGYGRS